MIPSFVLGFLHSYDLERWLLIDKGATVSRAGDIKLKWCGLGGEIDQIAGVEPESSFNEFPHLAMMREFMEESGHIIKSTRWNCFHIKEYLRAKIYCFQCACSPDEIEVARNIKRAPNREGILGIHQYVDICFKPEEYTFDLRYLIPMIILESKRGMLLQLDPEGINSDFKRSFA